jgi:hypothetical protein
MVRELSPEIVDAIASATNVEPGELDIVLANHIDPDALNLLAEHEYSTWTVTFELPDHEVTVTSEGGILVDGRQENDWVTA